MTQFGYTMMTEQARPDQLVGDVRLAEEAGFDFSVISDHYQPWLDAQGHSRYAWSILGAAAQATELIPLMTYVTCPILRYHPAVVAQRRPRSKSSPATPFGWPSAPARTATSTSWENAGRPSASGTRC